MCIMETTASMGQQGFGMRGFSLAIAELYFFGEFK